MNLNRRSFMAAMACLPGLKFLGRECEHEWVPNGDDISDMERWYVCRRCDAGKTISEVYPESGQAAAWLARTEESRVWCDCGREWELPAKTHDVINHGYDCMERLRGTLRYPELQRAMERSATSTYD